MATPKDAALAGAQTTGYIEPVYDEPEENKAITHVLAATSVRSLADLEGERQVSVPVHPNGQAIHSIEVPTEPDPAIAALDLRHAPLSRDAETQARKK